MNMNKRVLFFVLGLALLEGGRCIDAKPIDPDIWDEKIASYEDDQKDPEGTKTQKLSIDNWTVEQKSLAKKPRSVWLMLQKDDFVRDEFYYFDGGKLFSVEVKLATDSEEPTAEPIHRRYYLNENSCQWKSLQEGKSGLHGCIPGLREKLMRRSKPFESLFTLNQEAAAKMMKPLTEWPDELR